MLAHIGGIPVEEAVLSFAPLSVAAAGVGLALIRERVRRHSHRPGETHHSPEPQR